MARSRKPRHREHNPRLQAALIPHSQLHIYHGGHLGILTEADELAPVIETFLDGDRPHGTCLDEENPA